jgi:DNA-binding winged helix-turn-helix (wHTH) protein/Tfp pilus assembly protein PilF
MICKPDNKSSGKFLVTSFSTQICPQVFAGLQCTQACIFYRTKSVGGTCLTAGISCFISSGMSSESASKNLKISQNAAFCKKHWSLRVTVSQYEFDDYQVDVKRRLLLRAGNVIPITPKVFEMLLVLLGNQGKLVEKDDLMKMLWPDSFVEEGNLSQTISVLRKALGEKLNDHRYIVTVPGRGYRFVADVRQTPASTSYQETSALTTTQKSPESLAVLPFRLPGNADQENFLGMGMADAIIARLSNLRQVIVRPTSAVRKYLTIGADPIKAGRDLKVSSVLEGTIQRSGDRIRVTVQLINVTDEIVLWADKYDEKFTDIFAVQDHASQRIAEALMLTLTRTERQHLSRHYTEDTEAWHAYLKGRYYFNKRTGRDLKKGIEYFEQAIAIDPDYALAWAGIADSYALLGIYSALSPMAAMPKARDAATRALEIDGTLSEAWASLGGVLTFFDWNWEEADRVFKRAIDLNPNSTIARHWYSSILLVATGNFDEAFEQSRRALQIDPLSLVLNAYCGWNYYEARQYKQAIEQCYRTLEIDPNFVPPLFFAGLAASMLERHDDALAFMQRAVEVSRSGPMMLAGFGFALAAAGRRAEAEEILEKLIALSHEIYVASFYPAVIHAGLGNRDEAFAWLEKTFEERFGWLVWMKVEPMLDNLRNDPRFDEMLRRVGHLP